ncbi:hypothetical protein SD71_03300 [Cohnella kolymensis]|uniref:Uncharacterized protein n=1 Tax=Cohnella kolymensis TaxID=1590652 RepID=A0ABR5A9H0_9BACL|nr:hypothetical protein [Cohnella kolymensis]KIL37637.1 hypothetical protein SD71_03300 [Cohnella kolymensis]
MKTGINLLKVLGAVIPSCILYFFLIKHFPNTGIARIFALPSIFVVNTTITTMGIIFAHRLNYARAAGMWIMIILLTLVLTVLLYPQEYGPSVATQLWNNIAGKKY